jgi:probable phosphoglycerate mutase
MAILIIRHGETDLNAGRVLQWPDTPLSARGHAQAARLGERFSTAPIAHILVSDYQRALSTAQAVERTTGVPLEILGSLRERNYGDLRGKAYHELGSDPHAVDFEPPGGESWAVFHARVAEAWKEIIVRAATLEGDLCVVTHGLVLRSILNEILPPMEGAEMPTQFHNTSVTVVNGPPWTVQLAGCFAHLDGDLIADGAAA